MMLEHGCEFTMQVRQTRVYTPDSENEVIQREYPELRLPRSTEGHYIPSVKLLSNCGCPFKFRP